MQSFELTLGVTKTLSFTPRQGTGPGALTSLTPQWTNSNPSAVTMVVAENGMSAQVTGMAAGSAQITVAYQSTENAYPLRSESCTLTVPPGPADNLLFSLN